MKQLDITNQRFGRLIATERLAVGRRSKWKCTCDCGGSSLVDVSALRLGVINSCGCLRKEAMAKTGKGIHLRTEPGASGLKAVLAKYKCGARDRGLSWDLTDEEFKFLTSCNCHYCDRPPSRASYVSRTKSQQAKDHQAYTYNGIDRLDASTGYEPGNVVPACTDCNLAKQSLNRDEFLKLIEAIYSKHFKDKT